MRAWKSQGGPPVRFCSVSLRQQHCSSGSGFSVRTVPPGKRGFPLCFFAVATEGHGSGSGFSTSLWVPGKTILAVWSRFGPNEPPWNAVNVRQQMKGSGMFQLSVGDGPGAVWESTVRELSEVSNRESSVSSFLSAYDLCVCESELIEFFAERTEFAAELNEFSLPKQYVLRAGNNAKLSFCLPLRAQRLKKFNLAWNFQSRLEFFDLAWKFQSSGKKKAHKHKLFGPVAPGTTTGLSLGQNRVVPGTNPGCPWDKPGFSPYFTQSKPSLSQGQTQFVPGTNRWRRETEKVYVLNVYVPFSLAKSWPSEFPAKKK